MAMAGALAFSVACGGEEVQFQDDGGHSIIPEEVCDLPNIIRTTATINDLAGRYESLCVGGRESLQDCIVMKEGNGLLARSIINIASDCPENVRKAVSEAVGKTFE